MISMSNFCFTGPQIVDGINFTKKALMMLVLERGHRLHKHVEWHTHFLVMAQPDLKSLTATKVSKKVATAVKNHTIRISTKHCLQLLGYLDG